MENVTTRSTSATWDISKPQSIYIWGNFDTIIQRIEPQTDFKSHTIDLYDSQYFSKEYEDCSLRSSHFIRGWVKL